METLDEQRYKEISGLIFNKYRNYAIKIRYIEGVEIMDIVQDCYVHLSTHNTNLSYLSRIVKFYLYRRIQQSLKRQIETEQLKEDEI